MDVDSFFDHTKVGDDIGETLLVAAGADLQGGTLDRLEVVELDRKMKKIYKNKQFKTWLEAYSHWDSETTGQLLIDNAPALRIAGSVLAADFRDAGINENGAVYLLMQPIDSTPIRMSSWAYSSIKRSLHRNPRPDRLAAGRRLLENAFAGNVPDYLAVLEAAHEVGPEFDDFRTLFIDQDFFCQGRERDLSGTFWYEDGDDGPIVAQPAEIRKRIDATAGKGMIVMADGPALRARMAIALEVGEAQVLADTLLLLFPYSERSLYDRSRMTMPLAARVMLKNIADGHTTKEAILQMATAMAGMGHQAFISFYLYMVWLPHGRGAAVMDFLCQRGWFNQGFKVAEKRLKGLHSLARRSRWVPRPLRHAGVRPTDLMYLNVVLGRFYLDYAANDSTVDDRVDYYGEHLAFNGVKLQYDVETHSQRMREFFLARAQVAGRAWSSSEISTLDQWMLRYVQFGSSGSAGGHSGDEFGVSSSVSKRLWLANRDSDYIAAYVLEMPTIASTVTIVKREAGKLRQLLPARIPHWLVESMLIGEVESAILRELPLSLELSAEESLREMLVRRKGMMDGLSVSCVDWADFNITHTLKDMSEYFDALGDAAAATCTEGNYYDGISKGEFLRLSAKWCSATLYNMWLRNGADKNSKHEHAARGLWSGWRTTQFFNSSFNVAYCQSNLASMRALFGMRDPDVANHAGDDFFGLFSDPLFSMQFVLSMPLAQHDVNPTKQLADGEVGEFLRNEYFRDGKIHASLQRSIGSFTGSDLQAPDLYSGVAQAQGANEALNLQIRRGADRGRIEAIRYTIVQYWTTIKDPVAGTSATPSVALLQLDPTCGGLGCPRYGEQSLIMRSTIPPMPSVRRVPASVLMPVQAKKLLAAFAKKLHSYGLRNIQPESLRDDILIASYGSSWPDDVKREVDNEMRASQVQWILMANKRVQCMRLERLPAVPWWVDDYIKEVCSRLLRNDEPEGSSADLNSMATAVRAMALAEFSSLDSALANLQAAAARVTGLSGMVKLSRGRCNPLLQRMRVYLPEVLVEALVEHRWNMPTSTGGVVGSEFRAVVFNVLNYAMYDARATYPSSVSDMRWATAYCTAVCQRLSRYWQQHLSPELQL
ncbi:RNA-dependent RNA polymerase [Rosellinia necatrix megabirnavirus 2-W8]|uniref:RNA-directed RNA polymerase n=1 Tax=Rosellinia necatrix megabirnavirus 2-W8 TaxID=1676267 RepID=A0A0U4N4Q7_9VIRU|nr:RNA-dependent RNA polymerase [Rosellinia necatrix megabirnavirus 2-W8]BAU24262.1 RNA-dependent RNA polymerase [Rosellinia necatrix megabirnavirus 2-W8]